MSASSVRRRVVKPGWPRLERLSGGEGDDEAKGLGLLSA